VDLLVLSQAQAVVGDPRSSFASFVRELRALQGRPKATFYPVAAPRNHNFAFTPGR
jgi:hypothetical protein